MLPYQVSMLPCRLPIAVLSLQRMSINAGYPMGPNSTTSSHTRAKSSFFENCSSFKTVDRHSNTSFHTMPIHEFAGCCEFELFTGLQQLWKHVLFDTGAQEAFSLPCRRRRTLSTLSQSSFVAGSRWLGASNTSSKLRASARYTPSP